MVVDRNKLCTAYTDLTGGLTCKSISGNEYVLVTYHFNSNCITAQAIKNRKAATITNTWKYIHARYTQAGVDQNTYIMDIEISTEFIDDLIETNTAY